MKRLTVALLSTFVLVGCGVGESAPTMIDVKDIRVGDQKMTSAEYLEKHCVGKVNDANCIRVKHELDTHSTRGQLPKGY